MFANKGSVPGTDVLNIFLSIYEDALTGILNLKREDEVKIFYFIRGKLIWATSTAKDEKLENMLTSQGVVSGNLLDKVQEKIESPEAMGKFLLEKGLITLENLVNFTKKQLKAILISSLYWPESNFEFIQGNPPETFPTLDLDITEFVVNLILPDLKEEYVNQAVGSWQTPFAQNIDPDKTSRYALSQSQKELLSSFSTGRSIENVISGFENAHPLSLLKNIYFFLSCGLLVKKGSSMATESVAQEILKDIPKEIPTDILEDDGALLIDEPELPLEEPDLSIEEPELPLVEPDLPLAEPPAPKKPATPKPPPPPKKTIPESPEILSEPELPLKDPEPELPLEEPEPPVKKAVPPAQHSPAPAPVEPAKPLKPPPPPPPVEPKSPPPAPVEITKPPIPTDAEPIKPTPPPPVIHKAQTVLDDPEPIDIPPPPPAPKKKGADGEHQDLAMIFGKKKDADDDLSPYQDDTSSSRFLKDELPVEEKKRSKQFNVLLILISLALIISAVIFLVLPDKNEEQPIVQPKRKVTRTRRPRAKKPATKTATADQKKVPQDIKVVMKPENGKSDSKKPATDQQNKNNQQIPKDQAKPARPVKKDDPAQRKKTDKQANDTKSSARKPKKPIAKKDAVSIKPRTTPAASQSQDPAALFQDNKYQQAAKFWMQEIINNNIKYSVLLELDCQTESVLHAYSKVTRKSNFFLLPRKLNARNCFLVLWGKFTSQQEAESAIKDVPQYFWQQQNPPRVLELRPYL